jgi:hypothetical protein
MRIYVSLPISKGNANHNFYIGNEVQCRLIQAGHSVFNPGLSVCNFGAQRELDWNDWIYTQDLPWVRVSEMVLRCPGPSVGAEVELTEARRLEIPVVTPSYFECLNDLFEPGPITLSQQDNDHLMKWLLFRDDEEIREAALEGFDRAREAV